MFSLEQCYMKHEIECFSAVGVIMTAARVCWHGTSHYKGLNSPF